MAALQRLRGVKQIFGVLRTHQACMSLAVPAPNPEPDIYSNKVNCLLFCFNNWWESPFYER